MKQDRMVRVNRLLRAMLADLVPSAVKDPRMREASLVSVLEVRTTPDLHTAKVYVSVLAPSRPQVEQVAACEAGEPPWRAERSACAPPEVKGVQDVLEALHQARGFLRSELARRVTLRRIPELLFTLDTSQENAAHIEQVLREIAREAGEPRSGAEPSACAPPEVKGAQDEIAREGGDGEG